MRVIGKGAAAKVFLSRKKGSDQLYAIKAQKRSRATSGKALKQMLVEPAILKQLGTEQTNADGKLQPRNPFVVKLRWVFSDEAHLFFALDFHPGGDLGTMLSRRGSLHPGLTRFYAMELVAALTALHARGVVHRDLKPENVLIDEEGHIVLTDFGLAKAFSRIPSHADEEVPRTMSFCGTAEYVSPEVLASLPHSFPVDMWSLGVMVYEMLVGVSPFMAKTTPEMYHRILRDKVIFPEYKRVPQKAKDFIRELLQKNPVHRLSRFNIKEHSYFSNLNWTFADEKRYTPPYVPRLDNSATVDTQNFEQVFLDMEPILIG
ncbi:kinase-like protein [Cylindrobasidium torrendii FP15055 ss-10]|uniref:non-specific serine/threonine protein kinase n=1 Tax=Cylindrobasidium torrendii FP15055 ss-10 TaxID=1314674 RepID=A0A0D7BD72_9AGAR|nr:kinase-like protein [Cylindrobasidium torrendii FP15055 ss-10]